MTPYISYTESSCASVTLYMQHISLSYLHRLLSLRFQPSSSGRAAELLARENGMVPGFVGFGISTSNEPGYVPAVHGAEEIDKLVDADFRLVLRKLSKRDAVTKLKVNVLS